ncbi:MAG: hypothetical protein H0X36_13345 [Sphingomonadaceae bacterium]|nr:hypothetical protein [Sphingomonadaceae bacterium]
MVASTATLLGIAAIESLPNPNANCCITGIKLGNGPWINLQTDGQPKDVPASDRNVTRNDNGGPPDPDTKILVPGPLKSSSEVGDKVRTPDNDRDSFTRLKGGQGFKDNTTGTIMQRSNTNHSNSPGGEIKAGVRPGVPPNPGAKVTISGGKEGGCIIKKDGC